MEESVLVKYQGYYCKVLKVWQGGYYDLETVEKTKLGIIQTFLSVHVSDIDVSESKTYIKD